MTSDLGHLPLRIVLKSKQNKKAGCVSFAMQQSSCMKFMEGDYNVVESGTLAGVILIIYSPKTRTLALGLIYLGIDWPVCGLF